MSDHLAESVAVDPGDLYTLVRCFYAAGVQWSRAEQRAADRLNQVLTGVMWEFRPEHIDQPRRP